MIRRFSLLFALILVVSACAEESPVSAGAGAGAPDVVVAVDTEAPPDEEAAHGGDEAAQDEEVGHDEDEVGHDEEEAARDEEAGHDQEEVGHDEEEVGHDEDEAGHDEDAAHDEDASHDDESMHDEAAEADRTIEIVMTDLEFALPSIDVAAGETVRFVVRNDGVLEHEFRLSNAHRIEEHMAAGHEDHGEGAGGHHQEGGDVVVGLLGGESGEVTVTFPADQTLYTEFACLIPGHYEVGMKGDVIYKS